MPGNSAQDHLDWHRGLSGVPAAPGSTPNAPKADARPVVRRDSETSATPVAGSGSAALLEQTLKEGM